MKLFSVLCLLFCAFAGAADLRDLPVLPKDEAVHGPDWLIHDIPRAATVYRSEDGKNLVLSNGLIRRTFRLTPNAATVGFDNLVTGEALLRAVKPEARIGIDGRAYDVGGLIGQPNNAFLRPEWIDTLEAKPDALAFSGFETGVPGERMAWAQARHHAPGLVWPPKGAYLRMDYRGPDERFLVSVHYELYDGVPVMSKWITVKNASAQALTVDSFTCEILAAVERGSMVDAARSFFDLPNIHAETDFAFNGMGSRDSNRHGIHWIADPEYKTQVNYALQTPCLLEARPELGPDEVVKPGDTFESFHVFLLPFDGDDRERNGLAQRRMYRVIAPWTTENPLMMHIRFADWEAVKNALDQCAETGFEMAILTFGSGFNVEKDTPEYQAEMKRYADYARSKGVELGGYSLLASRTIDKKNDVVMPEGKSPVFGHSPCLGSGWGEHYFDQLYRFYDTTGFMLLEHDGSYPGDACLSKKHPGHRGFEDSQWRQWRKITEFYRWCRGKGVYLNVPDFYFLSGSSKTAMGYRETNWSLPRAEQVIHTRQNIYDGTWDKLPSMGWMFVPLTVYQGGRDVATIEPLDAHIDHYEAMLQSNLAMGVQACYRGPRLYDTERTKDMVKRNVNWFKQYRDILESDLVHGRRADARDIDWMLHVNPKLKQKGLLVAFNPLNEPADRTLRVNLYYTGLADIAFVRERENAPKEYRISRDHTVEIEVSLPGQGFTWFAIE